MEKKYICEVCKDTGKLGDKNCYECNPTGLRADIIKPEEIAEVVVPEMTITDTPIISPETAFGINKGYREVIRRTLGANAIPGFASEPTEEGELRRGYYFCTECQKTHNEKSRIGIKHLNHRAV